MKTEAELEADVRRAFEYWQTCMAEEEVARFYFLKANKELYKAYPKNKMKLRVDTEADKC